MGGHGCLALNVVYRRGNRVRKTWEAGVNFPSVQGKQRQPIDLSRALAFTRAIDEAAAAMFALQHEVLAAQGIAAQGVGREPYRS